MTGSFQDFSELRGLLDALCEESITAEQVKRLEELVLAHPEAEAFYVQYMSLFADLSRHFLAAQGTAGQTLLNRLTAQPPAAAKETPGRPVRKSGRFAVWGGRRARFVLTAALGLAAGLLIALFLPGQRWGSGYGPGEVRAEPTDNTVAVLLQAPGAEWEETGLPLRAGAPLPPVRLLLKAGFAHLEFYSGATVILQAPADFQLISRSEAFCARGKLWATVPPQAQGFTIRSPKLNLVDRGTEFGLQVGADERTEVHVFRGKVELYDTGDGRDKAAKELTTGRGLRLDGPGQGRAIPSDPAAFRTAQDLVAKLADETRERQEAWREAGKALRRDPSLVVYFPFQPGHPWSRTLSDQARGRLEPHDGVIVGCSWVTGRWSGKQGLEFKRVCDRVRFHVPGEFRSITLAAWVRVDALPNRWNSLMMTDGWEEGAPHWHISNAGKLELGVQGLKRAERAHYYSPSIFTPDRLGQWVHLAVVYDADARQVTHYVNGQAVARAGFTIDVSLRLGDVELGNWNIASSRNNSPIRYFNGCMDEFMLFSRALGVQEIERLYTQGQPPL
jgi:hypothetical protein